MVSWFAVGVWRQWAGLATAALMGACTSDPGFRCANHEECVDDGVQGVCQVTSYCSFPDDGCASGQRYGGLAGDGLAKVCVPPEHDPATTTGQPVATSSDGTTLDMTVGEVTSIPDPSTDDSTSQGDTTASSESSSGGPGPQPACVDEDLGSGLGIVAQGSLAGQGDDLSATDPSCGDDESGPDVAYWWTAPTSGEFRIETTNTEADTVLYVRTACDTPDLVCDDDGGEAWGSRVELVLEAGEAVIIVVDAYPGRSKAFSLEISQPT